MNRQQRITPKKPKRIRSAFTTEQLNYLEKQFKRYPYIGSAQRKDLALSLNISDRAVKIWFQNRRMKEKRESKELEDEQQPRELNSDQLKYIVPPTNELQRPLPHIQITLNPGHSYTNIVTNNSTSEETRQVVQGIETSTPVAQNLVTSSKVSHPPSAYNKTSYSSPDFKASAEFSINLCKKYKSETFSKPPYAEKQTFKMEVADIKMDEPKPVKVKEQKVPEDLSPSRIIRYPVKPPQTTYPGNVSSNPGFVSMMPTAVPFYTQPYISGSGGMVWKQVNVIPTVSSSASPVFAQSKPPLHLPYLQENFTKSCNCDCHTKQVMPQVPYTFPQQSPTPQYIITFQNPSTK